jgi:penicillin amidase
VIIGHNDRIAWGFTNVGPDVMDLYIEKINPANPNQYEYNGEWVDMEVVNETIVVGGGEPVELTVRYTRHGPIISEVYGKLEAFSEKAGIELPANYAISLRWTALEPGQLFRGIFGFNRAQNWEEFRQSASFFNVPAQNLVFADVDGNIGYQTPGWIPIRAHGDGLLPVPGWTDEFEWTGYIPFEELPFAFNPPEGYIVTANNAVTGPEYPHTISLEWAYGYRAQAIVDMIENAPGPIDLEYVQQMQGDNRNLNAENIVPLLLQIPLSDARLQRARALLEDWDYQQHMDSASAALFEVFWKHLLANTFRDQLPERYWPSGDSRWYEVVRNLLDQPDSPWWDDQHTPEVESRDDILLRSLAGAVNEMEERLGKEPTKWAWGDLHLLNLTHQTLGKSGIAPIENIFNRGPFRTSGGPGIVNATRWSATADNYEVRSLPSFRMIVDLSDLRDSLAMHTTGQSGHAYHPHYVDMTDLWRKIQYHPMLWSREDVEAAAEAVLRLTP